MRARPLQGWPLLSGRGRQCGGRYSFVFAVSENLHGPYRMKHEAAPCAGGGNVFRDREGRWWSTFFGNDEQSHFREKPGLIRVDFRW